MGQEPEEQGEGQAAGSPILGNRETEGRLGLEAVEEPFPGSIFPGP